MSDPTIECLQTFEEFQSIRTSWDEFMSRCFPEKYGRTHPWLSAWWETYHHGMPALVYVQRDVRSKSIEAAAPLMIRKDFFGGFPVRSLQSLGSGIGADDFLVGPQAHDFVPTVLSDVVHNHRWHLAKLHRLQSTLFHQEAHRASATMACPVDLSESDDYYVEFPDSYSAYQQSRSRKFRRNFNQAMNRLQKDGNVAIKVLDPFVDARLVRDVGREIAVTSWQYREGKSHFNDNGCGSFYDNLARTRQRSDGEEFTVLLVKDRPVAYLLGCRRGRTYFAVDTAYHADYRHVSAGRILFAKIFERLMDEGEIDRFDFEGSGEYKEDFATHQRNSTMMVVYHHSPYPRVIRFAKGLKIHAFLKNMRAWRRVHSEA